MRPRPSVGESGPSSPAGMRLYGLVPRLVKMSWRYLSHHRLQSLLLLVGIALGVAVVVAIDIANESARRSFRLTASSLSGKATHQVVAGPAGLDDEVYRKLRVDLGLLSCAPVLEDYVAAASLDGRMMRLLGLDPFAEGPFRSYLVGESNDNSSVEDLSAFMTEPQTVLMSAPLARSYHLRVGSSLEIERGSRRIRLKIAGLLEPRDELTSRALSGLLIADIATAQEVFGQRRRIGHIDLIADTPELLDQVRAVLPAGVRIEPVRTRSAAVEQLTESFELNLSVVSLLTLVVGVFLVYNTVTFFVVQRRGLIGILRALGVTRDQVFSMIILETLVLGVLGTLAGLGLGILLGRGAVRMVTQTINDLYFVLTVTDASVPAWSLFKGTVVGLAAALVSAIPPAWEAAAVAPAGVMRRSVLESRVRGTVPWITAFGTLMMAAGALLLRMPSQRVDVAFAALTVLFLGAAMLVPMATVVLMKLFGPVMRALGGAPGHLAPRSIVRSLSRTGVAIAALMVAVSIIVGIDVMVGSFRQTVVDWLGYTLRADVYIATPSGTASRFDSLDPSVARNIAAMPGVERVQTTRTTRLESKYGLVFLLSIEGDLLASRRFLWSAGTPEDVRRVLKEGGVLVSEPFANRHRLARAPGQTVTLPTDAGPHDFPVAAIYYDYGTERGSISIDSSVYHQWWRDTQLSSVGVYLKPGVDPEQFADGLRRLSGGSAAGSAPLSLEVISNRSLRIAAMRIFDRTFAITNALRVLVTFVAFIGVLGTLMALQFERQREIGVLRATGMTTGQLARMILFETGLMGLTAGLLALPVGAGLAWVLVFVINPRSFGWTIPFLPEPLPFVTALLTAVGAGLLAGIYPAWRFGRIRPAVALRTE